MADNAANQSIQSAIDGIADFHPLGEPNVAAPERIVSVIAGAALTGFAVKRHDLSGAALALVGGYLLFRGVTGQCAGYTLTGTNTNEHLPENPDKTIAHNHGVHVEKAFTIDKPAQDLYDFWRNFQNLPLFMTHLNSVTRQDDTHSRWVAKAPFGKTVAWDAEIINEVPGELIAWRSVGDADIPNSGSVSFRTVPGGRGTEVKVLVQYQPPAGRLGATIAKLWGEEPGQQIESDLRHFKNLMEAGEIPTTIGQPQGNRARHTLA